MKADVGGVEQRSEGGTQKVGGPTRHEAPPVWDLISTQAEYTSTKRVTGSPSQLQIQRQHSFLMPSSSF